MTDDGDRKRMHRLSGRNRIGAKCSPASPARITEYRYPTPSPTIRRRGPRARVPHFIQILLGLGESIDVEVLRDEGAIDVGVDRGAEVAI